MKEAGAIRSMLAPNSRRLAKIATVIGCTFWPKVSATIRSFQVQRNWKMASEAIAGSPSGRISRTKILSSEAPSIRADSMMSLGIPTKKLRSRKIANGSPNAAWKSTIEHRVVKPDLVVEREHRDQRHLQRHDEQRDHADEDPVAAGELEPGERVAGERADDDHDQRVRDRDLGRDHERVRDQPLVVQDRGCSCTRSRGSAA